MSEQVERRIIEILGNPKESPYGNPIPGLEELGLAPADPFLTGVVSVVEFVADRSEPVRGTVRRLGEPVQFDPELLGQLKQAGIVPGAVATFSRTGGYVLVQVDGAAGALELPTEVASHIFIAE